MTLKHLIAGAASIVLATGCAHGNTIGTGGSGGSTGGSGPSTGTMGTGSMATGSMATGTTGTAQTGSSSSCGNMCDMDGDGVIDSMDKCPNTPAGAKVNKDGCAASQLTPKLEPTFPPYGLTWTHTGDPGKAGGLQWGYTGINRGDLFHIYWVPCDDPTMPCGVSLDGPIDMTEAFHVSLPDCDLPNGKLVFTNSTHIALADGTTPPLNGRMTMTIVDANNAPLPFASLGALGVTGLNGQYGAEIPGTAYTVTILVEVQDPTSMMWTPYLDYYDAAPTPMAGGGATVSIGGSFYDE